MSHGLRKRLQATRSAEIRQAAEKLLEDESCVVSDHIGRIENLDKLIAEI